MGKISINGCGSASAKSPRVTAKTLHQDNFGYKKVRAAKSVHRIRKVLKQLANGNILSQMAALRNAKTY